MLKNILILLCICLMLPAQSATLEQFNKVASEATSVCEAYKTSCTVTLVANDKMFAITKFYGKIELSTKLMLSLNEAQLRGTIFHEVGHVVFKHVEKTADYLYTSRLNKTYNEKLYFETRKQFETQADKFAVYLGKFTNLNTDLAGALLIITPEGEVNVTHPSHPSTADRIKQIEKILGR